MKKCFSTASFFTIAALCIISSCDPVLIPDPIDPRVPKYTDDGNDVAGALINDTPWVSKYSVSLWGATNKPHIRNDLDRDSLSITFTGTWGEDNYTSISFGFRGYNVSRASEMPKLNGAKITLDGIRGSAMIYRDSECKTLGIGQIYFRSVKYDSETDLITISGTFGFNQNDPVCGNLAVTYGRFDFEMFHF